MDDKPTTTQKLEELFGKVDFEQLVKDELVAELKEQHDKQLTDILIHPEVYKTMNRVKFEMSKAMEKTLFSRKYATKKIKRRIFYEVIWWGAESRHTKCFYSVKKMRKFVNELHPWYNDYIEIEKTWCYRNHSPRHKWYYVSFRPNHFLCVEKW